MTLPVPPNPPPRRGGSGPVDNGLLLELNAENGVANQAALVALQVGTAGTDSWLPDGTDVWVATYRCKWRLRTTAVPVVANEIATSTTDGTRQWWRLDPGGAPDANPWLPQLAWSIAPTGNDEALGTAAAPLLTFPEFVRRMKGARMDGAYSVSVLGNQARMTMQVYLGPDGMLVIDGNAGAVVAPAWPATVQGDAAAAYVGPNAAGQEYALVTVDPVLNPGFDWTPYVGLRVRFSDIAFPHANNLDRGEFVVLLANPGALGNNVARVSVPNNCDVYATGGPALTGAVPNNLDYLLAEALPFSGDVMLDVTKELGATLTVVNLTGFSVSNPAIGANVKVKLNSGGSSAVGDFGNVTFYGCVANVIQSQGSVAYWECLVPNPGTTSQYTGDSANLLAFVDCGFLNNQAEATNVRFTSCVWENGSLDFQPGYIEFMGPVAFFDLAFGSAMTVLSPGVSVRSGGFVFGLGNPHALVVETAGFWWTYNAGTPPTCNAGVPLGEFRVLGVEYTWAVNLPYPAAATVEDVAIRPLTP